MYFLKVLRCENLQRDPSFRIQLDVATIETGKDIAHHKGNTSAPYSHITSQGTRDWQG